MRNVCQFCDNNPGYLQGFARGWVCNDCMFRLGLHNHDALTPDVEISESYKPEYIDDMWSQCQFSDYSGWGWDSIAGESIPYKQGLGYYHKPKKAIVVIEELECNPNDLTSATKYFRTAVGAKKVEVNAKRWVVEIEECY